MQKTYLEIKEANNLVQGIFAQNDKIIKSKFGYAWKRFLEKNAEPITKELNEKLEDNRIDNCLTDPTTKEILYNAQGGYKFSKEGIKLVLISNRKLIEEYDAKEIEIKPFVVKEEDLPELTEEEKQVLTGLVI